MPIEVSKNIDSTECVNLISEQNTFAIKYPLCQSQMSKQVYPKCGEILKNVTFCNRNLAQNSSKGGPMSNGFIHISPIQGKTVPKFSDVHSKVGENVSKNSSIVSTVHQLGTKSSLCPTVPQVGTSRIKRQSLLQKSLLPGGIPEVRNKDQSETNITDNINAVKGPSGCVASPSMKSANAHAIPTKNHEHSSKKKRDPDYVPGSYHDPTFHDSRTHNRSCHTQTTEITRSNVPCMTSNPNTSSNSSTITALKSHTAVDDQQKGFISHEPPASNGTTRGTERKPFVLQSIISEPRKSEGGILEEETFDSSKRLPRDISGKKKRKVSPGQSRLDDDGIRNSKKLSKKNVADSVSIHKNFASGGHHVPVGVDPNHLHDRIEDSIKRKREIDRAFYFRRRDRILKREKSIINLIR
ncbi:hypothetical protein QAD02_007316 [Eretmocerus hayati]|uniref:Uncharacterized protein n=1 Tax=Eretmocerus hayati TaxID=131215 RepID=A0ACC2N3L9_9HYME|nr:hypothetical protein QAD02_007316 [Eretmocerus hayati]